MLNFNPYCKWASKDLYEHAETCPDNKELWNLIRYAKPNTPDEHKDVLKHLAVNPNLTRNHIMTITLGLKRGDNIAAMAVNRAHDDVFVLNWFLQCYNKDKIAGNVDVDDRMRILMQLPSLKPRTFDILYTVLTKTLEKSNVYTGVLLQYMADREQIKDVLKTLVSKRGCPPHIKADYFLLTGEKSI